MLPPRLMHAAIAFAVTVAAYQAYMLAVVPFVEPASAAEATIQPLTADQLHQPPAALERSRPLLQKYFAPDHWCFAAPPIIVENGQTMVVLDTKQKYQQNAAGVLRVPRLAVIFFPHGFDRAGEPPSDAIILEPAGGATLQMDQQLGQGRGFGAMGHMQYGQLLGAVTLRSDMKEPGPQDDLLIETRDLYMNEELIRTTEAVTMKMGPHRARGRELVINFVKTDAPGGDAPATLFGKLDSLEISREVAALIAPGNITMFGAQTRGDGSPGNTPRGEFSDAPAQIDCTGPFRIDFNEYLASFTENVHVQQLHEDGALDELKNAHELTLYFLPTHAWGGDVASTAGAEKPSADSVRLEPATIEAISSPSVPLELDAPSQGAHARGGRLTVELMQRRVTLEAGGGGNVEVNYHDAEIKAPMVQYDLPPKGSSQRLGQMFARGGGGSLRAAPDPRRPGEILDVSWKQSMQMVRRGDQSVLVLDGRPRVEMAGLFRLWADQLELYLHETPAVAGKPSEAMAAAIQADRVVARGNVGIKSAELSGEVSQLDLKIFNAPETRPAGANSSAPGAAGSVASAPSPFERQRTGGVRRAYHIDGRVLEIDAVVRERRPQVAAIRVDGGVVFNETATTAPGDAPLKIVAEHLQVTDADTPEAKIEIRGGEATDSLPAGLAEISARGTLLRAPALTVNRGTNHALINSPGEAQLIMKRDVSGQPLAQPQPLRITWRDAMELDRDRITFTGNVFVEHPEGWLRTQRLSAVLTAPVQFDGAASGQSPEIAQLECWEGAAAEFDQHDAAGAVTSHQRLEVQSLTVNQITGAITGAGPGHVDSVHLSKGDGAWALLPDPVSGGGPPSQGVDRDGPPGAPQLKHLSIDFARGVEGNLHTRTIKVIGSVRTVYGPIDSWDQRLEMTPGGAPGLNVFWISCEALGVTESPLTRLQPPTPGAQRRAFGLIELAAEANVVIEGTHPEHGAFTAGGDRATYDQAKTLLMLHGAPATITYQHTPGGPFEDQRAKKWSFNQTTGDMKIEGFSPLQVNVVDPN